MSDRTIYLDPDPHDRRSRRIHVRPSRWFAAVELDREEYASAEARRGHDSELSVAYLQAVTKVRRAFMDRIWLGGYPGSFFYGGDSYRIDLFVQFPYVEETITALRAAELDNDYSKLHALADRVALPIDDWLAPGERELVRGVDFDAAPGAFLKFLRPEARARGLRLNGRATAGSVWVRPTLTPAEKQKREQDPEQYPGWVDRWTGYVEPDELIPIRPWVGGRGQSLSQGATPVSFRRAQTSIELDCACGMRREEPSEDGRHSAHHMAWALGIPVPKSLDWWGDLAVVTTQSPIAWRKLAYRVGRMPQRENRYDFNSWSHLSEPEQSPDNNRAYLLKANGYVIGYLAAHDTSEHSRWNLMADSPRGDQDLTLRPRIDLIWVANAYRRNGLGALLVQSLAEEFGCQIADVSWSTPISDAGQALARQLSPGGVWIS